MIRQKSHGIFTKKYGLSLRRESQTFLEELAKKLKNEQHCTEAFERIATSYQDLHPNGLTLFNFILFLKTIFLIIKF